MEFSTFEFLRSTKQRFEELVNQLTSFIPLMATLLVRISEVVNSLGDEKTKLLEENAQLKEQLAEALANDVADAEAIAAAQAEAEAARAVAETAKAVADKAKAKSEELQTLVDEDKVEEAQILEFLDTILPPSKPTV
jgi:septal ring factor EnvC (AmiA/AmiB activator)